MDHSLALLTLLHLLVPIYWLGGDLGTFLAGQVLKNPKHSAEERLLALKILLDCDMGPRTALILAFPTGFALAVAKGWLAAPGWTVALTWLAGIAWLAIAWAIHLKHGPAANPWRKADFVIRYGVLATLLAAGIAGLAGVVALPKFIAIKLLLLACGIALGLLIRRQLAPLFPAVGALRAQGASEGTNAAIASVLSRTTRSVMCIWVIVLVASLAGIATPL
jgi:hypothetical protein